MIYKDLFYGSWGSAVQELQRGLRAMGYGNFMATGFFGPLTQKAVSTFQKDNSIEPSYGNFGPKTRPVFYEQLNFAPRLKLWRTALSLLGVDASPNDLAPDEFGCAETVSDIIVVSGVDFPICVSTKQLHEEFQASPTVFTEIVDGPKEGDVILSPTGWGNGKIPNGHTGIIDKNGIIMSNSSVSGTFEKNYTLKTWKDRFVTIGGYPIFFWRRVS